MTQTFFFIRAAFAPLPSPVSPVPSTAPQYDLRLCRQPRRSRGLRGVAGVAGKSALSPAPWRYPGSSNNGTSSLKVLVAEICLFHANRVRGRRRQRSLNPV
jgi:hypothetical protein